MIEGVPTYPSSYTILIFAEDDLPERAEQITIPRFESIYDLDLKAVIHRIITSLQGDDWADGGHYDSRDECEEEGFESQWHTENLGRGFEVAKGSIDDLGKGWTMLKQWVKGLRSLMEGTFSKANLWDTVLE